MHILDLKVTGVRSVSFIVCTILSIFFFADIGSCCFSF